MPVPKLAKGQLYRFDPPVMMNGETITYAKHTVWIPEFPDKLFFIGTPVGKTSEIEFAIRFIHNGPVRSITPIDE